MHAFVVEGWGGGYALCPLVDCELQVGSTDLVPMLSGVEFRHLFLHDVSTAMVTLYCGRGL